MREQKQSSHNTVTWQSANTFLFIQELRASIIFSHFFGGSQKVKTLLTWWNKKVFILIKSIVSCSNILIPPLQFLSLLFGAMFSLISWANIALKHQKKCFRKDFWRKRIVDLKLLSTINKWFLQLGKNYFCKSRALTLHIFLFCFPWYFSVFLSFSSVQCLIKLFPKFSLPPWNRSYVLKFFSVNKTHTTKTSAFFVKKVLNEKPRNTAFISISCDGR